MATTDSTKYNKRRKRVDSMVATLSLGDIGGGVALTGGDTVELFRLPAGAVVLDVIANVKTVFNDTTAATLSVGDGGSGTRFHNAIDIKTSTGLTASAGVPYQYTTADTIDAIVAFTADDATTGEVEVEVVFLSPDEDNGYMAE